MSTVALRPKLARLSRGLARALGEEPDREAVTGLATRRALHRHLRRLIEADTPAAVLYVDLDGFKLVNDTLGHAAGDELLRELAARMGRLATRGDVLARQGGDEFVLVTTRPQEAAALAERLRQAITVPLCLRDVPISVGASIGIATHPGDGREPAALLDAADGAMYEAKLSGRNQISRAMSPHRRDRDDNREALALTASLPQAIARDELVLHWQPIVSAEDLSILGLEALVRWEHPQRGLLGPGMFLPFAQRTGLIRTVDEWVARAVARQRHAWRAAGLDPYVGFNLAPQYALWPRAYETLIECLTDGGLPLDHVTIELSESEALREDERMFAFLHDLHAAGITLSLDDFGRAYSSLERLRDVPARWVKLDGAFLRAVPEDPASTRVLTAILDLVRALGLELIVEGVERPEQLELLRRQGVGAVQGFLTGRPQPADALEQRLWASPASRRAIVLPHAARALPQFNAVRAAPASSR